MEIFCYALSAPDGSEWRQRIERDAEHFLDVSAWAVPDIAGRISADRIHIALNLNGYTKVRSAAPVRRGSGVGSIMACSLPVCHCCNRASSPGFNETIFTRNTVFQGVRALVVHKLALPSEEPQQAERRAQRRTKLCACQLRTSALDRLCGLPAVAERQCAWGLD